MGTLIDNLLLDSRKAVKYHCPSSAFDVVHGGLDERGTDGNGNSISVERS